VAHLAGVPHFSLPILQNRCTFLFQNHQNVQRILIIGCSGAGKSTFARNLHDVCPELELIHLDRYYWRPGWVETPKAEWEAIVKELAAKERWIMDGGYTGSLHLRAPRADGIYFFDFPIWLCLWRAVKRITLYKLGLRNRPDMAEGCPERFDYQFFKYIITYNQKYKPRILRILNRVEFDMDQLIFVKNDRQARAILANFRTIEH